MKKIITIVVLITTTLVARAEKYLIKGDSLIVQFGNNTRMIIQAQDKSGIINLKNYDLNKIIRDMGATLDSSGKESYIYINEQNGKKYLRDTVFTIGGKDANIKITINDPKSELTTTSSEDEKKVENNETNDDGKVTSSVTRRYKSPRDGFDVLVGFNAYAQNTPLTYRSSDYDLRPWGSRFVSLNWVRGAPISRGKDASLGLDLGVDVSWYNMMYEGNNSIRKDANAVSFPVSPNDLYKSKLTAAYLNVSLMPTLAIHKGIISYLSVGMYGGYRLDSYSKTQDNKRGRSERDHSNMYINNFRYGIGAEVGIRRFLDVFVQYDLGELFESNKGPAVRMVSFGVRI